MMALYCHTVGDAGFVSSLQVLEPRYDILSQYSGTKATS